MSNPVHDFGEDRITALRQINAVRFESDTVGKRDASNSRRNDVLESWSILIGKTHRDKNLRLEFHPPEGL
jgi:hypothetical protein